MTKRTMPISVGMVDWSNVNAEPALHGPPRPTLMQQFARELNRPSMAKTASQVAKRHGLDLRMLGGLDEKSALLLLLVILRNSPEYKKLLTQPKLKRARGRPKGSRKKQEQLLDDQAANFLEEMRLEDHPDLEGRTTAQRDRLSIRYLEQRNILASSTKDGKNSRQVNERRILRVLSRRSSQ